MLGLLPGQRLQLDRAESDAPLQLRRPDFALAEVALLWISILVLIVVLIRKSVRAGALLIPYLIWVSIAAALNYQVVVLNGPFS